MEQQKLCPARRTGGRSAEEKDGKSSKIQCLDLPKSFPIHLRNYNIWNPSIISLNRECGRSVF